MGWRRKKEEAPNVAASGNLCTRCDYATDDVNCSDAYRGAKQGAEECNGLKARYEGVRMNVDLTNLYLETADGSMTTVSRTDTKSIDSTIAAIKAERPSQP